jgi:YtkA-like
VGVRLFRLLAVLGIAWTLPAQLSDANYQIRYEPDAKLQTGVPIPYKIDIHDSVGRPVRQAVVTLLIETPDHLEPVTYKAPMTDPGVYIAKPVFPHSGQWNVTVHAQHDDRESARTITYTVPD